MKWYHGTSKEKWNLIKKEGVLFGFDKLNTMPQEKHIWQLI